MVLNEAIARINNVKWDRVGTNGSKADVDLAYEFLRRLAQFFKDESIKPIVPLVANIAKLLGDVDGEVDLSDYCKEAPEFLDDSIYKKRVVEYYIQLAKYADKHSEASKYLSVYEPLIRILERGGMFVLRLYALDVEEGGHFPLKGWYERFVEKEPLPIDHL